MGSNNVFTDMVSKHNMGTHTLRIHWRQCPYIMYWPEDGSLEQKHVANCVLMTTQGIHKRVVPFQKLTRNLFLTLHGHNFSSSNCPSFSCATSSSLLMLTAGPRGQFPRWRRTRKRLSVCCVLRCPNLWLQCSVSFVHGLEKTHHVECDVV